MNCINAKENLDALLDGELEKSAVMPLETHLKSCVDCRTEFKNLRSVGAILRQNRSVSAAPALDEKVLAAFRNFHEEKRAAKVEESNTRKSGWFGIPRLAFAAAFALLVLTAFGAFQLGKTSAGNSGATALQTSPAAPNAAQIIAPENRETAQIQTINVPVIEEKIVKVPVVREKIVTRIIYKYKDAPEEKRRANRNSDSANAETKPFTVKSRLRDNQYSTQINLEGFQLVSDLKPQIIKGENNEK